MLGVGSATAIFSVVKAVLLNQLRRRNPDRVVALWEIDPAEPAREWVGGWMANEWRMRSRSFESNSLYGDGQRILLENEKAIRAAIRKVDPFASDVSRATDG